jgi:hypothetical protein
MQILILILHKRIEGQKKFGQFIAKMKLIKIVIASLNFRHPDKINQVFDLCETRLGVGDIN